MTIQASPLSPSASSVSVPASTGPKTRALTTRTLDFWLLGGMSLFIWAGAHIGNVFREDSWAFSHHFNNFLALSGSLALLCNYPHFMASYHLAYSQGIRFVANNAFQLIVVPIVLILVCYAGYVSYHGPQSANSWLLWIGDGLRSVGLYTRIGTLPTTGQEIMGWLINAMNITVGWHYSKQTFGCVMVMANFDGYKFDQIGRTILKWSLHSIWFSSFIYLNLGNERLDYFGVPYYGFAFPNWFHPVAMTLCGIALFGAAYAVIIRTRLHQGQWPSLNMLIAPVAFFAWYFPGIYHAEFATMIVPFFHSLQYLAFIQKVERGRLLDKHPRSIQLRGTLLALGLAVTGFLAFEWIPNSVDVKANSIQTMNGWFFFVCTWLFINIHHYFIDNVIWRFKNPHIRRYLLS